MATDWNTPSNTDPNHVDVLEQLGDKDTYSASMGQTGGPYDNRPEAFMIWDNVAKLFRRLTGGVEVPQVISVAGGGTGGSTASDARSNLGVSSKSEANGLYLKQASNGSDIPDKPAFRSQLDVYGKSENPDATTSSKGYTQLNNTLTSTSTSQALTAAQGKALSGNISALTRTEIITSLGGDFSSGEMRVERAGNLVTISGYGSHSSSSSPKTGAILPVWAYPVSTTTGVVYSMDNALLREARVSSTLRNISFDYRDWSGSLVTYSFTTSFNITYTTFG